MNPLNDPTNIPERPDPSPPRNFTFEIRQDRARPGHFRLLLTPMPKYEEVVPSSVLSTGYILTISDLLALRDTALQVLDPKKSLGFFPSLPLTLDEAFDLASGADEPIREAIIDLLRGSERIQHYRQAVSCMADPILVLAMLGVGFLTAKLYYLGKENS